MATFLRVFNLVFASASLLLIWLQFFGFALADKKAIDNNVTGLIAAFGDFDSDKLTDVFYISEDGRSVHLLKGSQTGTALTRWDGPKVTCELPKSDDSLKDEVIVAVIPGDFYGNSVMDVLVVTQRKGQSGNYNIWPLKSNVTQDDIIIDCRFASPISSASLPLIVDYEGDMILDILASDKDGNCILWSYNHINATFVANKDAFKSSVSLHSVRPVAFVAFNQNGTNDLVPDVIMSGYEGDKFTFENWSGSNQFKSSSTYQLTEYSDFKYMGQSSFVDFNLSGNLSHIVPVCDYEDCNYSAILIWEPLSEPKWKKIMDLKDSGWNFAEVKYNDHIKLPVVLRHGDVDGDGYVDFITVLKNKAGNKKAVILKNVADSKTTVGRKLDIYEPSITYLNRDSNEVKIAAFYDLFEDGKIDVLTVTKSGDSAATINAHMNTEMVDACFLKVLVISGRCYEECPHKDASYGTNQAGPYVCFEQQDLEGNTIRGCSGQLSQSMNFALQMPYSIFGLGATPNFVEELTVSIPPGTNRLLSQNWTQIVPDAQVVIIPNPVDKPKYWISKLFVTPSEIVLSTLITLASICCVLVLIIGILHRREILEDLAEHEEYKRFWPESRG